MNKSRRSKMSLREAGLLVKLVPLKRRPSAIGILLPYLQKPMWIRGGPSLQYWIEWAMSKSKGVSVC